MKDLKYDRKNNLAHAQHLNGSCLDESDMPVVIKVAESSRQSKGEERRAVNQVSIYFILEHLLCQHLGSILPLKSGTQFGDYAHPLQHSPSRFPNISASLQPQKIVP